METIIKYPVIFLTGLLVALLMTPAWLRLAPLLGLLDRPGDRKLHRRPIPVGGGMAVFLGFHAACAVLFLLPWQPFSGQIGLDWWIKFIPLSLGVVALGLWDDRHAVRPFVKLAGQTLLATAAYLLDIRLQNVLGLPLPEWLNFVVTVFWFLALMNAFNLIDGIDGLAAGIGLIAALGIGISLVFRRSPGDVLLFLGFAGACLGFLRYNYYPASVFLGDTGSLFIGFTLAALSISTSSKGTAMAAIGMPLLAVGVPLFDAALAVWRRSVRRMVVDDDGSGARIGIETADADHLHHRLLRGGRRHDQVALVLYGATAVLAAVGILVSVFHDRTLGILAFVFIVGSYTVFRHLAWIELRDSGAAVLKGIAKPVRRNATLLFYILGDVIILNISWVLSVVLLDMQDGVFQVGRKRLWLTTAPLDVALPFMMLLLFRAYSRVWYLARIAEFVSTGMAVVLGCALACAIRLMALGDGVPPWPIVLHYTLLCGLATPAIVGIRASLRVIQDLMQWLRYAGAAERPGVVRALIWGAGHRTALFLRQNGLHAGPSPEVMVLGIIAEDVAIRGHFVHGVHVLGTSGELPALIRKCHVDALYLVEAIDPAERDRILQCLENTNVRLIQWQIVEEEIARGTPVQGR